MGERFRHKKEPDEAIEISKDGAGRITRISFNKPAAIKVTAWREIIRAQIYDSSLREIRAKKGQLSVKFTAEILIRVKGFSENNRQKFLESVSKTLLKADQVTIADVSPKSPFISIKNPDNHEVGQIIVGQKKNGGTSIFLTLKENKDEDGRTVTAEFDSEDNTFVNLFDGKPIRLEKNSKVDEIIIMPTEI